jgi:hypothetical protein
MTSNTFGLIIGSVQAAAVVATLILVYWQLRKIDQTIGHDSATRAVDYFLKFNELEITNPGVMEVLHKEEIDAGADLNVLAAQHWAYIVIGTFERLFKLNTRNVLDKETWASWNRWLTEVFIPSDVFSTVWPVQRRYFEESFVRYIDSQYQATVGKSS